MQESLVQFNQAMAGELPMRDLRGFLVHAGGLGLRTELQPEWTRSMGRDNGLPADWDINHVSLPDGFVGREHFEWLSRDTPLFEDLTTGVISRVYNAYLITPRRAYPKGRKEIFALEPILSLRAATRAQASLPELPPVYSSSAASAFTAGYALEAGSIIASQPETAQHSSLGFMMLHVMAQRLLANQK
jgi:hypothetical protein